MPRLESDITTEASLEALMAEVQALRAQVEAKEGEDDSLVRGLQEFRKSNEMGDGGIMAGSCKVCGKSWRDGMGEVRPEHGGGLVGMAPRHGWHSFRTYEITSIPHVDGKYHAPDAAPKPIMPEEVYIDEKSAALVLGITLPALRKLVKAGTLEADKFGKTTLIRRPSLNAIVATKEAAEAAGIE